MPRPGRFTQYPLYMRLGRPRGRSGQVLKISPTPGFNPRTVQPIASRYTDYAIPAPLVVVRILNMFVLVFFLLCLWCNQSEFVALFMVFKLWICPGFIFGFCN